ncbi:hypothetical protein TNCV_4816031 [Trichonephila clavipes]|nr:hypothetical protein TNCV_4816031 [Trichonephila clavipes]
MQNISLKYPGRVHRFLFERQSLNYLFIKLTGGTYRILPLRDNHRNPNLPTKLFSDLVALVERVNHGVMICGSDEIGKHRRSHESSQQTNVPKRLYSICLETVVAVAEERADKAGLFVASVSFGSNCQIPVLIRRCNSARPVRTQHLLPLPSSWNRCQSLEMALWAIPSASDTSSWVRPHSSCPIILPR